MSSKSSYTIFLWYFGNATSAG